MKNYIFLITVFLISMSTWLVIYAAPMLGFGKLWIREMLEISWSVTKYKNRFISTPILGASIWISSAASDAAIKAALLNYGYGNCYIWDNSLARYDQAIKQAKTYPMYEVLSQSKLFLICPN